MCLASPNILRSPITLAAEESGPFHGPEVRLALLTPDAPVFAVLGELFRMPFRCADPQQPHAARDFATLVRAIATTPRRGVLLLIPDSTPIASTRSSTERVEMPCT